MGKYLLSVLSILLLTVILSLKVCASDGHEITSVDLVKNENIYKAKVSVKLPPQPGVFSTILDLKSLKLAQGFQKAAVNGFDQLCKIDGSKVMCDHEKDTLSLAYEFVWQPQHVIESEFCTNVTLEKQKSVDESKNYVAKFVTEAQNTHSFIQEIVIRGVTTEGNLSETYADFAFDKSVAILWGTNVFASQENQISEISFVKDNSFHKLSKDVAQSETSFRPYAGSLSSFEAQEQYKIFLINTKKNSMSVESANLVLCKKENIKTEKLAVNFLHEIYNNETFTSTSPPSKNIIITWDEMVYDAEIVPTVTSTPTSTQAPTLIPTLQPTIVVSTSNTPNTPTPTVTNTENPSIAQIKSSPEKEESDSDNGLRGGEVLGTDDEREHEDEESGKKENPLTEENVPDGDAVENVPAYRRYWVAIVVLLAFVVLGIFISKPKILAKVIKKLSILSVFVVLMFVFARPAAAQNAYTSIKITDSFIMHGTGAYTGVMNIIYTYVTKPSTSGKFVISKNSDGTGDIEVGNYLQGIVKNIYYASSKSYYVGPADGSGKHYICPDKTTLSPQDVSAWFPSTGATYQITFRFITSCQKDFPVSDLYLVFVPDPTPTPSATPTSTHTPTPTPFAPFLDLPWDYRGKGLGFSQAATAMTSYFDHEYPLLSQSVNGLSDLDDQVYNYRGIKSYEYAYTNHDGYDYAKASKANYGDPQLAAADGIATLHRDFWQQGNAIYIDHKNGFQTRYYHLDHKDLLTSETGKSIDVKQGQMIGRIGFTGNTDPKGEGGAHIHFMVVFDKNHDGNFSDNVPDGLVDPYGWMGEEGTDPWENAAFQYPYGVDKTGMRSNYLWKYELTNKNADIGQDGGELAGEGIKIQVPRLTLDQILNFHMKAVPRPKDPPSTDSTKLEIISPVTDITAKDEGGQYVRYFNNPFNIVIDLTSDVAKYYKPGSISIYSSNDNGDTWQKEPTSIDLENNKAIGTSDHLTLFAVMGEKKDDLPPTTSITVTGSGKNDIFRSDVEVKIDVFDEVDNFGIDYTLFTLDSEADWQEYISPINIASEGAHMIRAFSADKSGNIESHKMLEFVIDKTAPEIDIKYATESWEFEFRNSETQVRVRDDNNKVAVEDEVGNVHELSLTIQEADGIKMLRIDGGHKNGETINYKPSIYAINNSETGMANEYLLSGNDTTRVITGEKGEVLIIRNDEIEQYMGERPLQLETENDILKIKANIN